ncbi:MULTISPECIES: DapH/DapD/GlmU-related protein [unclassified Vibrio]|uniref:acyltransferase n=1 Tax=Vibrio TaxID=662 RepID=UPI0020A2ED61|nr:MULTISPECIES: acyltransferase [unclassified Vibrio]
MFINKLIKRAFYNPYKMVSEKSNSVFIGNSNILRKSFEISGLSNIENEKSVKIGNDNILGCRIIFESKTGEVSIGNRCFINSGTSIISIDSVIIGNYVTIAWGVTIYDHDSHSLDYMARRKDIEQQLSDTRAGKSFIANKCWSSVKSSSIKIGDDAWIGMNAVILKGVTIGERAVVAAGSIVTKDVPADSVVAGNPAKVVKRLSRF